MMLKSALIWTGNGERHESRRPIRGRLPRCAAATTRRADIRAGNSVTTSQHAPRADCKRCLLARLGDSQARFLAVALDRLCCLAAGWRCWSSPQSRAERWPAVFPLSVPGWYTDLLWHSVCLVTRGARATARARRSLRAVTALLGIQ